MNAEGAVNFNPRGEEARSTALNHEGRMRNAGMLFDN
jgi:hypothetical protein